MPAPRYLALIAGQFRTIVAAVTSTVDSLVATGADGKIDVSFLPAGVGADTKVIVASEALASGDWVNIHISSGIKVRKADATTAGKRVQGFVLANVLSAGNATVYLRGINNALSGLTPGSEYFLSTTPGAASLTVPSTTGNLIQPIGPALSATELLYTDGQPAVEIV